MTLLNFVSLSSGNPRAPNSKGASINWKKLLDQVINAAIVGGITFFSTLAGTGGKVEVLPALIAFGLAFCIKLAKDRKL